MHKEQKIHKLLSSSLVFHNPRTNKQWGGEAPIRKILWQYALKKAGVRYRTSYRTRHTYVSMMLSAGQSLPGCLIN